MMSATTTTATTPKKQKKAARRWLRRAIAGVFVVAVAAMLVMLWMPKPLLVETASVSRGMMRVTVDEAARTRVKDRYVIGAPLNGNLLRVDQHAGDTITRGAVLARMLPMAPPLLDVRSRAEAEGRLAAALAAQRQAVASIERAKVAIDQAKLHADDARRLAQSGAVGQRSKDDAEIEERLRQQELASAQFASQVADHDVEVARAAIRSFDPNRREEQLDITAPADGVVLKVLHESAGPVQAGAPIVEIGDPRVLEVAVDVLTSDAVAIHPGTKVSFERWGGDLPLAGHVRVIEPAAFTKISALGVEEQRATVVVDIDTPREQWSSLGDGYRLESHLVVWENPDVLRAPSSAVFRSGDAWVAYVVRNGRAVIAPLEIGHRNATDVEVVRGLEPGEVVVTHPSDRLTNGARIQPM